MGQLSLFIVLCLVLAGCSSDAISKAVGEQVATTHAVDLRTVGAGDWDRVCMLGPYSGDEAAQETLGFSWPVEWRSSIEHDDGISLLLFVREQQVLHWSEHPRDQGDFSNLSGRCFPPEQAQFVRAIRADNWPEMIPRPGP